MNDLVNISSEMTMTTVEIAELCGKRHDNVMIVAKRLKDKGIILAPEIEEPYTSGKGRVDTRKIMRLSKTESLNLVANLSPEFTARVIDRWQELEEKNKADVAANLNDPNWLRGTLLTYTEKVLELESKIEEDKPKTQFYDRYCNSDGLYGLQNAARALSCRPNLFIRWLKQNFLFYQGGNLVSRIRFIQMGIFETKNVIVEEVARPQTYITPKGLKYLEERVPENIKISAA